MLSDPQSVTINAVAKSLPLILDQDTSRTYQTADGLFQLVTKQNVTKERFRREVRISQTAVYLDPITELNREVGASVYIVIDEPRSGFTDAELTYLVNGLKGFMVDATTARILGGEM